MKNETEKLNRFKLAVFAEVEQQAQTIISEAEALQKSRLTEAKSETRSELRSKLDAAKKEYEEKMLHEVSSRSLQAQRNVLIHRNELIDKVFDNVRKGVEEFCRTDKYPQELKAMLENCISQRPGSAGTAFFARRDIELGTKLCRDTKLTAEVSDNITLGGVSVTFSDCNLAYDCTFDSSFEKERQDFSKAAGLAHI